ncbi:MAG: PQQ-binding-like beta-propeller repeat protein [Polyangiaceae bacterium]|nr:PQQ-binding-like beta-propeller repeat protein [Polyangiaceae bacterium]
MSAIHVVVRPDPTRARASAEASASGLFDVVIDGVNVTARIGEGQALALLAELARLVAALVSGRRRRATLRLYTDNEAWEVGLEADGTEALVSVYRAAPSAEVAVDASRVSMAALRKGVLSALDEATRGSCPPNLGASLALARAALAEAIPSQPAPARVCKVSEISSAARRTLTLVASGEFRCAEPRCDPIHDDPQLEQADLHALLLKGTLIACSRDRRVALSQVHLFLVAERLVALAEEVLDAWQHARPLFRRIQAGELRVGVRRGPGDASLALTLGRRQSQATTPALTFPEITPTVLVKTVAEFARALSEAIVRHDAGQQRNLRLAALAEQADRLTKRLRAATEDDSLTNVEPDAYRVFSTPARPSEAQGRWEHGGRIRFTPRWVAAVPNIDLRSALLVDGKLVVGSQRELICLATGSGDVLWKAISARAGSVATASGLVRIFPDGRVVMHDMETGQVRFSTKLTPRGAGGATGAVVQAPGLPKMLVVAEGDRQVTALDLVSGEIRWRHTAKAVGCFRVRRAGKLLIVAGGDTTMVALEVDTGAVIWRVHERLPFTGDLVVEGDSLFAVSGARHGPSSVHRLDVWTGRQVWTAELSARPLWGQPPLLADEVIVLPVRDPKGVGALAVDRESGQPAWAQTPGVAAHTAAWLGMPDCIVANTADGTLLCLEAKTGLPRFCHVFSRPRDGDQPRRLEPTLRAGALFVPQHQVYVVRPRDGEVIGAVPGDLVPDWLRVDEQCNVYLAEESGHLSAFRALAELTRIK